MEFLYLLEKIRVPGLNELMLAITTLGEETAFLVIALIVFWCVDKKKGYYVMTVGFLGTMANQFLKLLCRVPRPWVLDPNFSILEQAREAATGYSFPSGHTQSAVGTFGSLAVMADKKWQIRTCIAIAVLVGFSRMYIGVHTPSDVLVSAGIACVLIGILMKPVLQGGDREMRILIWLMSGVAIAFLLFVHLWPFPADIDPHNYESGLKNAYTMLGCLAGVAIVYAADKKLDFPVHALWWVQIIKVVAGLLLVLAVKELTRTPLELLLGSPLIARSVRYCLLIVVAGIIWPLSFSRLSKIGVKK